RAFAHKAEHPLVNIFKIGITTLSECTQQIKRRRRLAISHILAIRIGNTGSAVEFDTVDDITTVRWKLHPVQRLHIGRARFCELPSDTSNFNDWLGSAKSQHHCHLQKDTEKVANIIRAMFCEAFCAIATLKQKRLTFRNRS